MTTDRLAALRDKIERLPLFRDRDDLPWPWINRAVVLALVDEAAAGVTVAQPAEGLDVECSCWRCEGREEDGTLHMTVGETCGDPYHVGPCFAQPAPDALRFGLDMIRKRHGDWATAAGTFGDHLLSHPDEECWGDLDRHRLLALLDSQPAPDALRVAAQAVVDHRAGRHGVIHYTCLLSLDDHMDDLRAALKEQA